MKPREVNNDRHVYYYTVIEPPIIGYFDQQTHCSEFTCPCLSA
jgi:hypothetical protein